MTRLLVASTLNRFSGVRSLIRTSILAALIVLMCLLQERQSRWMILLGTTAGKNGGGTISRTQSPVELADTNEEKLSSTQKKRKTTTTKNRRSRQQRLKLGKSKILPRPVELFKANMPMKEFYEIPNFKYPESQCSCGNPLAKSDCCRRILQRDHKMGCTSLPVGNSS